MDKLVLDDRVLRTIALLAKTLNTSGQDIVKRAVDNYVEKIKVKNDLTAFAGSIEEEDVDDILNSIYTGTEDAEDRVIFH